MHKDGGHCKIGLNLGISAYLGYTGDGQFWDMFNDRQYTSNE